MIIIDTNVLVASLVEEEEDHEKALALLQEAERSGEEQYLTYGALIELSKVLYREKGSEFSASYVKYAIEFFKILKLDSLPAIAELYFRTHKTLSFVDCEIIALARENGASILTFDGKLLKAVK